jgi:hypothetical protein
VLRVLMFCDTPRCCLVGWSEGFMEWKAGGCSLHRVFLLTVLTKLNTVFAVCKIPSALKLRACAL